MKKLIEELTKVNPSNLSEEGLKLFNKINEIIDRNEEVEKNLHNEYELGRAQAEYEVNEYWKSLIKEKIEELKEELERDKICIDFVIEHIKDIELMAKIQVLEELLTNKKNV